MFGMLDYRAHRLYWLLTLPLLAVTLPLSYGIVVGSVLYSVNTFGSVWVQIAMAVLIMELASLVLQLVVTLLQWMGRKTFLFFIDVVPSEGRSKAEAIDVLTHGNVVRYITKLKYDPYGFDDDDQRALVNAATKAQGWLVRMIRLLNSNAFSSSPEVRTSWMVYEVHQRAQDPAAVVDYLNYEFDRDLECKGLFPSTIEKVLSSLQLRHMIYKYLVLVVCFVVYWWNY